MKPLSFYLPLLASSCLALSSAASAQSNPSLDAPAPRVPRPPLVQPQAVPQLDTGAPTALQAGELEALERRAALQSQIGSTAALTERLDSARASAVPISASDERYARVYWDTDEHGAIWVRARQYKASFDREGATYMPLFGSEQPRHFPLAMSLARATSDGQEIPLAAVQSAVRDGERVVLERGIIDEVYEVGVESLEQTFVIGERPQGDLKLFVSLASEMSRSERDDGFEFSNEFGSVRYSRAFVREADGTKRALPTRLVEGGVEIAVEREYLDSAQFPLVVDPLVSTFDVDASAFVNEYPAVAYDATTDRHLYAYRELATATDSDIYSTLVNATGAYVSGGYADLSTADWAFVSVANLNAYDQFLVTATEGNMPSPGSFVGARVKGRLTGASAVSYDIPFTIAEGALYGDVGGDPYFAAPAYYCVAYEQAGQIRARLVTSLGTLVGGSPLVVDAGGSGVSPIGVAISSGNGAARWNIAWQRGFTPTADIYAAQVEWDGSAVTTPAFAVSVGTELDFNPHVSSPFADGQYVVTFARDYGPDDDVMGALISGGSVLSLANLNTLEPGSHLFNDQRNISVDSDGRKLAILYYDILAGFPLYVSTFFRNASNMLAIDESRLALGAGGPNSGDLSSTASTGGAERRFAVGWSTVASDIKGALIDVSSGGPVNAFCAGDGSGAACPCGNNGGAGRGCANSVNATGARLIGNGEAYLAGDTLVLTASGMPASVSCLFFQGTSQAGGGAGTIFGDGLRCAAGTVIRLGTKTNNVTGSSSYPTGSDVDISVKGLVPAAGAVRYYQAWYRNAAAFCTSSTFNLTNGVSATWLP